MAVAGRCSHLRRPTRAASEPTTLCRPRCCWGPCWPCAGPLPAPRCPGPRWWRCCCWPVRVWCYLTVAWAGQQALAWDGANRTVLYALIFALCSPCGRSRGPVGAVCCSASGLAIAESGAGGAARCSSADQAVPLLPRGPPERADRLRQRQRGAVVPRPLPCAILAGRREVHPPLRGVLLGAAVCSRAPRCWAEPRLAARPAALGWSRSSPCPGGAARSSALAAVGAGVALALDPLLDVYSDWKPFAAPGRAVRAGAEGAAAGQRGDDRARHARGARGRARARVGGRARGSAARWWRASRSCWSRDAGYAVVEEPGRPPPTAGTSLEGVLPLDPPGRLRPGRPTATTTGGRLERVRARSGSGAGRTTSGRTTRSRARATDPELPAQHRAVALAQTGIVGGLLFWAPWRRRWSRRFPPCGGRFWAARRPARA